MSLPKKKIMKFLEDDTISKLVIENISGLLDDPSKKSREEILNSIGYLTSSMEMIKLICKLLIVHSEIFKNEESEEEAEEEECPTIKIAEELRKVFSKILSSDDNGKALIDLFNKLDIDVKKA